MNKTYKFYNILLFLSLFYFFNVSAATPFDPALFQLYTLNDIGSSANPLSPTSVLPLTGAGGNIYLSSSIVRAQPNNLGGQPYGIYAVGNVTGGVEFRNASLQNVPGGIEAGGNVNMAGSIINGPIHAGGNLTGTGTVNGNVTLGGQNTSSMHITGTVTASTAFVPTYPLAQAAQYFVNASNYWSNLANTVTPIINGNNLTVNLAPGRNVVTLTLAQLNNLTFNLGTSSPSSYLIINVPDALTNGTLKLTANSGDGVMILLNVPNVTNLTYNINSTLADGFSILSPNSNLTVTSPQTFSVVDGNIIAYNLVSGNFTVANTPSYLAKPFVGFQADQAIFNTPEPSTYLILGSLLILFPFFKRSLTRKSLIT